MIRDTLSHANTLPGFSCHRKTGSTKRVDCIFEGVVNSFLLAVVTSFLFVSLLEVLANLYPSHVRA